MLCSTCWKCEISCIGKATSSAAHLSLLTGGKQFAQSCPAKQCLPAEQAAAAKASDGRPCATMNGKAFVSCSQDEKLQLCCRQGGAGSCVKILSSISPSGATTIVDNRGGSLCLACLIRHKLDENADCFWIGSGCSTMQARKG